LGGDSSRATKTTQIIIISVLLNKVPNNKDISVKT